MVSTCILKAMYPEFSISRRLRVENLVVEVRDYELQQENEFEFTLPHFGIALMAEPNIQGQTTYWQLPSSDEWIPHRQIGVMPPDLSIRVRVPKGHSKTLVCVATDQHESTQWTSESVAAILRIARAETYTVANALLRELEQERLAKPTMVAALGSILKTQIERQAGYRPARIPHTLVPWRMQKIENAVQRAVHGETFDIKAIAKQCRMSRKYLLSQFLLASGLSLNDYLWSAKVEQAKLLIFEGHSFGWITNRLNFSGPSHFTSRFARHTGLTPSEYRRRVKQLNNSH